MLTKQARNLEVSHHVAYEVGALEFILKYSLSV